MSAERLCDDQLFVWQTRTSASTAETAGATHPRCVCMPKVASIQPETCTGCRCSRLRCLKNLFPSRPCTVATQTGKTCLSLPRLSFPCISSRSLSLPRLSLPSLSFSRPSLKAWLIDALKDQTCSAKVSASISRPMKQSSRTPHVRQKLKQGGRPACATQPRVTSRTRAPCRSAERIISFFAFSNAAASLPLQQNGMGGTSVES